MKLQQLINIANDAYPDDMILQYFEKPKGNHGDTLAKFITVELEETFSEESDSDTQIAEAIRAMNTAKREIDNVIRGLEAHA